MGRPGLEPVVIGSAARSQVADEDSDPVVLIVRCDCGFEARAEEKELVPAVQKHGRDVHNMDVTPEQVLAMAHPA